MKMLFYSRPSSMPSIPGPSLVSVSFSRKLSLALVSRSTACVIECESLESCTVASTFEDQSSIFRTETVTSVPAKLVFIIVWCLTVQLICERNMKQTCCKCFSVLIRVMSREIIAGFINVIVYRSKIFQFNTQNFSFYLFVVHSCTA